MKKIALLGAKYDNGNMGVNALTAAAIRIITAHYPDAEIILFDFAEKPKEYMIPANGKIVKLNLINIKFKYGKNNIFLLLLYSLIVRMLPHKGLKKKLAVKNFYLRQIIESDCVLSIAGGDSFSDMYGYHRYSCIILPQLLAIFLRIPLLQLPQTFGPFKGVAANLSAKFILRHSVRIFSRDANYKQELRRIMDEEAIASKCRFCHDVAFVLEPRKPLTWSDEALTGDSRRKIGINVSGLLWMGGYSGKNMFGLKEDYKALIHEIIDYLIIRNDSLIVLVPHVIGESTLEKSDSEVCADLLEQYGKSNSNIVTIDGPLNQNEIKYVIGLTDIMLASRMHACIAALSQTIPSLGMAYSDKFMGVFKSIEMDDLVIDLRTDGANAIKEKIDILIDNASVYRNRLSKLLPHVQDTIFRILRLET